MWNFNFFSNTDFYCCQTRYHNEPEIRLNNGFVRPARRYPILMRCEQVDASKQVK